MSRIETDSMGQVSVPEKALYGAQTQRAVNNFTISGNRMPDEFISAVVLIKKVAAIVNFDSGLLSKEFQEAIIEAADSIHELDFDEHFPVDVFQTGSGTSSNMNVNEVIANICASRGVALGANDHVNMSQSSNDVIPTAIHISTAIAANETLLPAVSHLSNTIETKAEQLSDVVKTGRTHLMDAMPLTFQQELSGWKSQVDSCRSRILDALERVYLLAQGGTAIGTGVNTPADFDRKFAETLGGISGYTFKPAESKFAAISSIDSIVEFSSQTKVLAVVLTKIANDLRLMNSGPLAGLGEIELAALQPGSSIMPGKVNPVIPEAVCMAAAQVIGNDTTITLAGQSGNFQLNVMLPVVARNVLESIRLLGNSCRSLADLAISSFTVNGDRIDSTLSRNPILVTALNTEIGYNSAAEIAKEAYRTGEPIIDVAEKNTDISRDRLNEILNPRALTQATSD